MNGPTRSTGDQSRLVGLGLAVAALALLFGAVLGTTRSNFLVQDLAYLGTGGLGGLACLAVGGAVYVASRSARRCEELDRLVDLPPRDL
jgi:hypothetical protein